MGFFTAFDENAYRATPFTALLASTSFEIESARALAWAAQLAYETADSQKFDRILTRWGLRLDKILDGVFSSILPISTTNGFIAHIGATTIIVFAGTEPDNLLQWLRNFSARPVSGVHEGFGDGVDAVWREHLLGAFSSASDIFFSGHSLGGALCIAAAYRLCNEMPVAASKIRGVYTMGTPRVGTEQFARAYNSMPIGPGSSLGQKTYRLVYGEDIVPHAPPTRDSLGYRHVGRALSCLHGGAFNPGDVGPVRIEASNVDAEAQFALSSIFCDDVADQSLPSFPAEHMLVAKLADRLKQIFRDHLMDRYLGALGAM